MQTISDFPALNFWQFTDHYEFRREDVTYVIGVEEDKSGNSTGIYHAWVLGQDVRHLVGRFKTVSRAHRALKEYDASIADQYGGRHGYTPTQSGLRGYHRDQRGRRYQTDHPGEFNVESVHARVLEEIVKPSEEIVQRGLGRMMSDW